MERERKSLPQVVKKIDDRTVTGIFAVHGNVDQGSDRSWPGSFARTFNGQARKARFLWGHDFSSPTIASIKSLRELNRAELPDEVLAMAPEATGGAEVVREYYADVPMSTWVLTGIKAGDINEMSYGYDALRFEFTNEGDTRIRELREMRLYDVSDVLWGMNEATMGAKSMPDLDTILKELEARIIRYKAGARHSANDTKQLNAIHAAVLQLGATNCKGVVDDTEEDSSKTRPEPSSLTLAGARLRLLQLGM